MKRRGAQRKRSPVVQLGLCRRELSRVIRDNKNLPGIDQVFAFVSVGAGRSAVGALVNPWSWEPADLLSTVDHWMVNRDEWQQVEDLPNAANVDELARAFVAWAGRSGITCVAVLVGHPEGAATLGSTSPAARAAFVSCLERAVAASFK